MKIDVTSLIGKEMQKSELSFTNAESFSRLHPQTPDQFSECATPLTSPFQLNECTCLNVPITSLCRYIHRYCLVLGRSFVNAR